MGKTKIREHHRRQWGGCHQFSGETHLQSAHVEIAFLMRDETMPMFVARLTVVERPTCRQRRRWRCPRSYELDSQISEIEKKTKVNEWGLRTSDSCTVGKLTRECSVQGGSTVVGNGVTDALWLVDGIGDVRLSVEDWNGVQKFQRKTNTLRLSICNGSVSTVCVGR